MSSGKILVAQGGGPTAVINQSLVGVALEARRFQNVKLVYGATRIFPDDMGAPSEGERKSGRLESRALDRGSPQQRGMGLPKRPV